MKALLTTIGLTTFACAAMAAKEHARCELAGISEKSGSHTRPLINKEDGQVVNVSQPVVDLKDFKSATISKGDHGAQITVEIKPESYDRLKGYMVTHKGQRLAYVVNDQVVLAPVIDAPVSQEMDIGPMKLSEARAMVDAINNAQ